MPSNNANKDDILRPRDARTYAWGDLWANPSSSEGGPVCVCVCVVSCAPVYASLEAIVKHIETIWNYTVLCFSGILRNPLPLLCFLSGWSGDVWSSLWFFPPLVFVPWMGSWKWYATVWSMSVSFQQIFAWRPFVMAVIASFQGPWATIFCIQGGE